MIRFSNLKLATILFVIFSLAFFNISDTVILANSVDLSVTVTGNPHCNDSIDNDGDSLTDYPSDLGCSSALDENEVDPTPFCGDSVCNGSETCSSCSSDCGSCSGSGGGGGGGGGGSSFSSLNSVIFKGLAYPGSKVTILKNGVEAASVNAGPDANFEIRLSDLSSGTYVFGTWAQDNQGRRSSVYTFTVLVTQGITTSITGIFVSPTIAIDKIEVRRGDNLNIFGQGTPNSDVDITINSETELTKKVKTDAIGLWLYKFNTLEVERGDHSAKSRLVYKDDISPDSIPIGFKVGDRNVLAPINRILKGDLNRDGRVNLKDFSIMAYWYKRSSPPAEVDLKQDNIINITDFSIMAFYWTG